MLWTLSQVFILSETMKIARRYFVQTLFTFLCFLWSSWILHRELWNIFPSTTSTTSIASSATSVNNNTNNEISSKQENSSSIPSSSSEAADTAAQHRNNTDKQEIIRHGPPHRQQHDCHPAAQGKFITFELIQNDEEYNYTFDPIKLRCRKDTAARTPLPIPSEVGVTDFRTRVQTNLNILYLGDSVGTQFAQSFQDAAGAKHAQTIRYAWGPHKLSHIARVKGGGTVAGLRVTGFFLKKWMNALRRVAPYPGGGWLEYDVTEMKRLLHHWRKISIPLEGAEDQRIIVDNPVPKHDSYQQGEDDYYNYTESDSNNRDETEDDDQQESWETSPPITSTCSCCQRDEKNFDVVVYQFPAAWIYESAFTKLLHETMTEEAINRSITDTINLFCPKTVILQTVPIMNNVFSALEFVETNRNIFNVVHKFRETNSDVTILVMDLAALSTTFLLRNALSIGALTSGELSSSSISSSSNANTKKDTTKPALQSHANITYFQQLLSHYAAHEEETNTYSLVQMTKNNNTSFADDYVSNSSNSNSSSSSFGDNEKGPAPQKEDDPLLVQAIDVLLQQRLRKKRKKQYWTTIISHGCGKFVKPNTTVTCPVHNQFSADGQHWCMDVIGSRIDGVLACLLQCSLKSRSINDCSHDDASSFLSSQQQQQTTTNSDDDYLSSLKNCERKCNSIFMNLSPISFENGMYKRYHSNL
jgi:hypothetical protein